MRVAVVTANLGGHDERHPTEPQTVDADWWYFTDASLDWPPAPWDPVHAPPRGDPRMAAKRYRMTPWNVLAQHYDFIVWVDANTEVTSPRFLADVIAAADNGCALTTWAHPVRDDVGDEAAVSLTEQPEKYGPWHDAICQQLLGYDSDGLPHPSGLYATGTLVWNLTNDAMRRRAAALGGDWLRQCETNSPHDQLSLPYVAWVLNETIGTFPFAQVEDGIRPPGNRWLRYHPHTRST